MRNSESQGPDDSDLGMKPRLQRPLRFCFRKPIGSVSSLGTKGACGSAACSWEHSNRVSLNDHSSGAVCVKEGPGLERPLIIETIEILRPTLHAFSNKKATTREEFLSKYCKRMSDNANAKKQKPKGAYY